MIVLERMESTPVNSYRVVPVSTERREHGRKHKMFNIPFSLKIPWIALFTGFFLARAMMLDGLLPFGIAYLAAIQKNPKLRSVWPLIGVMVGYASLAPFHSMFPYYISTVLIWTAGARRKQRLQNRYWVFWILFSFMMVKLPLALVSETLPIVWITTIGEVLIALAGYSVFSSVSAKSRLSTLNLPGFQVGILLIAILLGVDLVIAGLHTRVVIMFYLILASARLDGAALTLLIGPFLAVFSLFFQFPLELAIIMVVLAVAAGFLVKVPLGLFLSIFIAYLLTFGLPIEPETIPYLLMGVLAASAVYLTPTASLRQLERVLPGTKKYAARQKSHAARVNSIIEERVLQFGSVFQQLAVTLDESSFVGQQLASFSSIVTQLGAELSTNVKFAEAIEEKLWQAIDSSELEEVTVLQKNNSYEIVGRRASKCGEEWCNKVSKECETLIGDKFCVTNRDCLVLGKCGFDIMPKARYRLGVKTAKLSHGQVSGDNNSVFELTSNKIGLLMSDGMGMGEAAAANSLATISLLEKMIKTGYNPDFAVKIINQTLLARNANESFATIDFVVADLQQGLLEFIKIGAAPSFIKRDRDVEVIQNHALPIGILNYVEVEPERRLLNEGDFLVMVTDGVLEFQRDITNKDEWIRSLLRRSDEDFSCQDLANMILVQSLEASGGNIVDDMMVLVAKLEREDLEIDPYQRS